MIVVGLAASWPSAMYLFSIIMDGQVILLLERYLMQERV